MRHTPRGAVALVEPGYGHKEFLKKATPRYALLKYHHANRLLKRGETAESWFPDSTQVITTTNIVDSRNATIPLEHNGHRRGEIDIVREFKPDYHVPADRSDYLDFDDDHRYEKTKECMVGTVAVTNHITDDDLDTQIIPFIKTATAKERQLCYQTVEQLGLDMAALYCNSYFNDGSGILIDELIADLELVAGETRERGGDDDPLDLLTISCLSPNVLTRAPSAVVAGSGQMVGANRGWRDSITPTNQPETVVSERYADVEARVAAALDVDIDLGRYQRPDQTPSTPASGREKQESANQKQ